MESRSPFGVINISGGEIAAIGTIADIREATRYVDGRWDLVTLGTTRFRVVRLDRDGRLADWQQTERATKSRQSAFADCLQYKQIEFPYTIWLLQATVVYCRVIIVSPLDNHSE